MADKMQVQQSLRYDRSAYGFGRTLRTDIPHLNLMAGDRLHPALGLRDVGQFERLEPRCSVLFWRCGKTDRVVVLSPILQIPGVSMLSYGVDLLHAWALGPLQRFVAMCIWYIIKSGMLSPVAGWLSAGDRDSIALNQLKSALWGFYEAERRRDPAQRWRGTQAPRGGPGRVAGKGETPGAPGRDT